MTIRNAAIVQVVLEGVPLPAAKSDLVAYARHQSMDGRPLGALERIPDREYTSLDEVGEAIAGTQPDGGAPMVHQPAPESDAVPGGAAYLQRSPEPGEIRDEPEILDYEQQLVREPAPVGEGSPERGSKNERPG